ncbi:type IV pilus biogenesis/stability protein PilW [Luminiphilus sp. nBUS_07]|uniref:type IV pilus biogenesis/stability protein PilW n=1 Tax=Luminiphilus sp. nBUS_07 TaxID=3395314 RepID=UPI003EC11E27
MKSVILGVFVLATVCLLSSCITETVGGIDNEGDPQAALERRVELARQYIGRGDWENAKRNLELANNIDAGNASVHEAFGLVYQSTGEYERAEESFKRALRIDPKLSRARNNYAAFLFFLGRYQEAEQEFAIVAEDSLYSGRPLAYINLGMSRLNLGNGAGAEDAFSRALRMDRRNPIALLEMGYLRLAAEDVANAESYYGVYRTVVPRQSPRGFMLGVDISRASGDKDAQSSYELALRNLYPDSQEYRALQARQGLQ